MKNMNDFKKILDKLLALALASEDYIAFGHVDLEVELAYPELTEYELRDMTLKFVRYILNSGYFKIGELLTGGGFENWDLFTEEAINKIRHDLETRNYSDVAFGIWFHYTPKAAAEAKRLGL